MILSEQFRSLKKELEEAKVGFVVVPTGDKGYDVLDVEIKAKKTSPFPDYVYIARFHVRRTPESLIFNIKGNKTKHSLIKKAFNSVYAQHHIKFVNGTHYHQIELTAQKPKKETDAELLKPAQRVISKFPLLQKELKKISVAFVQVPWKGVENWSDLAEEYVQKKTGGKEHVYVTKHSLFTATKSNGVWFSHSLSPKSKDNVHKVFKSVYGSKYTAAKIVPSKKIKVAI